MPEGLPRRNAAVLVGNGLSIAFNDKLNLAAITREMIARIQNATDNGDEVVHAMKVIANRAVSDGEVTDDDFEKLVGAFDSQALTLDELSTLASLVAAEDTSLKSSIDEVATFSQRVRDMGVSYVLKVILDHSRGDLTEHDEMHGLIRAIVDEFGGDIHFGNLNYDTLLLNALLAIGAPLTDLGREEITIRVIDEDDPTAPGSSYQARALRKKDDFLRGDKWRVKLLQLHGSLTYWHDTSGSKHLKINVDVLRRHDLLARLREGSPAWRPSVVLAKQRDKAHHVVKHPFKLAYDVFQAALTKADRWIVIGYSFRDTCVNDVLRQEFLQASPKPRVLVSTYGDALTREEIELALGWDATAEGNDSNEWLYIDRQGAKTLKDSWWWSLFTYDPPALWDES